MALNWKKRRNTEPREKLWKNINVTVLLLPILIMGIGLLNLYSISFRETAGKDNFFLMQMLWGAVGLGGACILCFLPNRLLYYLSIPFYAGTLFLLLCVFVFGVKSFGAKRWLDLGFLSLQPSELMKHAIIFMLARYFGSNLVRTSYRFGDLLTPFFIVGIPAGMIILQPDLGTAMIAVLAGLSVFIAIRIEKKTLITLITLVVILIPCAWFFVLKDYQKERVISFLNPMRDPMGSGYHAIQSTISIGSGRLFGKGFYRGTQAHLDFLPANHTDFVFSVFAEEWGFFYSVGLILLYTGLIVCGFITAKEAGNRFGSYLALGATTILFWHAFINIGMVMGLLPVVGVPLPFFSYGGTAMVSSWFSIGIFLNVRRNRFHGK